MMDLEVVYTSCAALDVHKRMLTACRWFLREGRIVRETQTFGTTTRELERLRQWLAEVACTHVALESTGVYWQPVYNVLEGHFELLLVNAKHVKHVPGRKTDVQDAEWLAQLLRYGLLRASFVPPRYQRDLRDLTRNRAQLVSERATVSNRIQKVLEGANIKLASVASDVVGVSGRAMLEALIAGQTDPEALAKLAHGKLREKRDALIAALEGAVRPHHCFLLLQHLEKLDFLTAQVQAYDARIVHQMELIDALVEAAAATTPATTAAATTAAATTTPEASAGVSPTTAVAEPQSELPARRARREPSQPLGYRAAVGLLDPVPGVAERGAQTILAEIGTDMSRFPTVRHLGSWVGLAPGNDESAGKRRSGKTTAGNAALRKALMQAAHGAILTKGSYFGALYHRLAARRGKRRALVAVAHALLVVIYHMLRYHEPYRELGRDYYDERRKESVVELLVRRLEKLGYQATVELKAAPSAV